MNSVSIRHSRDRVLTAYGELLSRLLPQARGFALYDSRLVLLDIQGEVPEEHAGDWLRGLNLLQRQAPVPAHHHPLDAKHWLMALELRDAQHTLLGLLVAHLGKDTSRKMESTVVAEAAECLYPLLPILKREFAAAPQPESTQQEATAVIGWLREALAQDRMQLYAQRIMPLQNFSRASGYELLVRLRDQDGHIVAPEEFLSAAYRYQLLPAVDRWVTEHALQLLAPYGDLLRHSEITIALNVSGQSMGDRLFVQRLVEQLSISGVAPGNLIFEIAEQTALAHLSGTLQTIQQLHPLGCRFALDDFGAGMHSLAILQELPVARVKIDGSLIRDILTNSRSEAAVKAIVQHARSIGIETVAEFVENEGIARKVRALGVDYGQGYVFARPEPLEQVLLAVQRNEVRRVQIAVDS